jgi:mannitol/fructose-specific phosphotransferase system IIA component (Ntr-type)
VLSRESVASKAIGDGLAVPHGRTNAIDGIRMSAGIVEGVEDYQSPDGVPVRVCVLVITSEAAAGTHLKVLGRLARLMRNDSLKQALFEATDAAAFAAVLTRAESP